MTDEATQAEDYRYLFGIAQQLGYPSVLEALEAIPAADEITRLNAENTRLQAEARESLRECGKWAREAGEAKGRLEMSEAAGIVEGWRERAEKAEALVDEMREGLTDVELPDRLVKIGHFLTGIYEKDKARDVWEAGRLLRALITKASRDSGHG